MIKKLVHQVCHCPTLLFSTFGVVKEHLFCVSKIFSKFQIRIYLFLFLLTIFQNIHIRIPILYFILLKKKYIYIYILFNPRFKITYHSFKNKTRLIEPVSSIENQTIIWSIQNLQNQLKTENWHFFQSLIILVFKTMQNTIFFFQL